MDNHQLHVDALIVGAGMTGLMAAITLQERGVQALVLEGSSPVGGRLASRQMGPGLADTGAQFFTVRSQEFQQWVERWIDDGLVYIWSRGWSDGSLHRQPPDGHFRYAARGGMLGLAHHLARGLDVRTNVTITAVRANDSRWQVHDSDGKSYSTSALILTPPVPQSLGLLKAGEVALPLDTLATLEGLTYLPNLTGLFWIEGPFYMPPPGAIQRANMPVSWVADNQRKGISSGACIVTAQMSPERSLEYWHAADDMILDELRQSFVLFMGPRATIREEQLIRWQYAIPERTYAERCMVIPELPTLVLAGDSFGGPRLEGAALSGMAAGQAVTTAVG